MAEAPPRYGINRWPTWSRKTSYSTDRRPRRTGPRPVRGPSEGGRLPPAIGGGRPWPAVLTTVALFVQGLSGCTIYPARTTLRPCATQAREILIPRPRPFRRGRPGSWCGAQRAASAPGSHHGSIIFAHAYPRDVFPRAYPRDVVPRAYPRDAERERAGHGRRNPRAGNSHQGRASRLGQLPAESHLSHLSRRIPANPALKLCSVGIPLDGDRNLGESSGLEPYPAGCDPLTVSHPVVECSRIPMPRGLRIPHLTPASPPPGAERGYRGGAAYVPPPPLGEGDRGRWATFGPS